MTKYSIFPRAEQGAGAPPQASSSHNHAFRARLQSRRSFSTVTEARPTEKGAIFGVAVLFTHHAASPCSTLVLSNAGVKRRICYRDSPVAYSRNAGPSDR
jgi:hypothetical protein